MLLLLHLAWTASLAANAFGAADTAKYWVNPGDIFDHPSASKSANNSLGKQLWLVKPLDWEKLEPTELTVRFDIKTMHGTCNINLLGYTESGKSTISKTESPFVNLASGTFVVNSKKDTKNIVDFDFKCRSIAGGNTCELYHMGYLEMNCSSSSTERSYSPIIPLGWFVHPYYKDRSIDTWAQAHCQNWLDKEDKKVQEAVRSLSCHPNHAYADASAADYSFLTVPQNIIKFDTYSAGSSQKGTPNPGQRCYLSTPVASHIDADLHASPTAECCYGTPNAMANQNYVFLFKEMEDPAHFLLHGSTAYRSHPFGVDTRWTSSYLVGQVPHLSHWYWDLLPYRYCCMWWKSGGCSSFYHKARPSPKVQPPRSSLNSAFLLGNFIARPFPSGASPGAFMCNKHGTFWLLKTSSFKVQARTGFLITTSSKVGTKSPTAQKTSSPFITGLAFEVTAMPNLRFQVVVSEASFNYHVLVTDTSRKLTEKISTWSRRRDFGYVVISNVDFPEKKNLISESFHLTYKKDQLAIKVFLPQFGREFMSAMFSANSGATLSGGLLSEAASSSASLSYLSTKCEEFRVPDTDSLFVPFDEKSIDTVGSPLTAKPAAGTKGPTTTTELKISGKKLTDAGLVACLAVKHQAYCDAIKAGLDLMQKAEALIQKSDPKKDPFAYCKSPPDHPALVLSIVPLNAGLHKDEVLFAKCPNSYNSGSTGNAKCVSDAKGKTLQFGLPSGFHCKLNPANEKLFTAAKDWYKARGSFRFHQHEEKAGGGPNSWRPGQSPIPSPGDKKSKGNQPSDDDRSGRLGCSAALVAATVATACLTRSWAAE